MKIILFSDYSSNKLAKRSSELANSSLCILCTYVWDVILSWTPDPAGTCCKQFLPNQCLLKRQSTQTKCYNTFCLCCMFICVKGRTGARTHGSTVTRRHTSGPQHFPLFSPALGDRSDEADDNVDTGHSLCATDHVLHWHCPHQGT